MKKVLFSLALVAGISVMNAQSVIWSEDFETMDLSEWTLYDEDGDGHEWEPVIVDGASAAIASYSYDNATFTPLTPDNWIVSPAIDLSNATNTILNYAIKGQDPAWADETYSVYVATTNDVDAFLATTALITESVLDNGPGGVYYEKELDLSSMDGEAEVYIAFRHHDSSDMFSLHIDDVIVKADETMAVSDLSAKTSTVYPNPVVDTFNVDLSSKFNASNLTVTITDLSGKTVKTFAAADSYNVSDLAKGVYLVTITDGKNTETKKIVKR